MTRNDHADFSFNLLKNEFGEFLLIEDANLGNRSVTNDIENVLFQIKKHYESEDQFNLDEFNILYLDSEKIWDGIKTKDGKFLSFFAIREADLEQVMIKFLRHKKDV